MIDAFVKHKAPYKKLLSLGLLVVGLLDIPHEHPARSRTIPADLFQFALFLMDTHEAAHEKRTKTRCA